MWLAIEGVVGAGKTTTTELVGRKAGLTTVLEQPEQHPFLEAYYRNPARFAVETELAFMLIQARQLHELDAGATLVSDFAPAKNLIFARLQSSAAELQLLELAGAHLWRDLPQPDLTVFLDVPVDICLDRVARRGRKYELNLKAEDLDRIRSGYLKAFSSLGSKAVRIELNGTEAPEEAADVVMQAASL